VGMCCVGGRPGAAWVDIKQAACIEGMRALGVRVAGCQVCKVEPLCYSNSTAM
jgi:hypothetical protein